MEVRDLKYNYDNSSASISKTHDSLGTLYKYDLRLWQSSQKTGMTRFCQDLAHFYEYINEARSQDSGLQTAPHSETGKWWESLLVVS